VALACCAVFGELALDNHRGKSMILGRYKIIQQTLRSVVEGTELYDLVADPAEKVDLARKRPVLTGYLRTLLCDWSDSQAKRKAVLKKPRGATLDKETEEVLRALGYLQ
jgi:hypothetical protein